MASIVKLGKLRGRDTLDQTGQDITITEPWLLRVSAPATIGEAYSLLFTDLSTYGFPSLGQGYNSDLEGVKCVDRPIRHDQGQLSQFIIDVKYSNKKDAVEGDTGGGDTGIGDDPIDASTVYSYAPVDNQKVVSVDTKTKKAISYSNGRAIIPPFTENFPLTRVTVTRNETNFDNNRISRFQSKVNSGSMRIDGRSYSKGTVQFENVSSTTQYTTSGRKYYSVTYTLLINVDGFARKVIEADSYQKVNGVLKKSRNGEILKLKEDGTFMDDAEQIDPSEFLIVNDGRGFNTLEQASLSGLRL